MDLLQIRDKIDAVDKQLVELFCERMRLCADVADYKAQNGLPVLDAGREEIKLKKVGELAGEEMSAYTRTLFREAMALSRAYQTARLDRPSPIRDRIEKSLATTPQLFPSSALVACQGVEGAFSQKACEKLFADPQILYFSNFEGVFAAVAQGLCRYGVVPVENSTAGSVAEIYDLFMKYDVSIVRSTRLRVEHCLLAKPGVQLADVKEVISHPQALSQCDNFLKKHDLLATACKNTAMAAQQVAGSERTDLACLSSVDCAMRYNLNILSRAVQDHEGNTTRFLCIAKPGEIYPGADRTSIMMILPHKPGSLYQALSKFHARGLNLTKLESRPLPQSDFEMMFYFDLGCSIYDPRLTQALCELEGEVTTLAYLGSYQEVV